MHGTPALEQAALDFVNDVRSKFGAHELPELLPGKLQDSRSCPIAESVGGSCVVTPYSMSVYSEGFIPPQSTFPLPLAVRSFVEAYDRGDFPWLVIA